MGCGQSDVIMARPGPAGNTPDVGKLSPFFPFTYWNRKTLRALEMEEPQKKKKKEKERKEGKEEERKKERKEEKSLSP